MRLLNDFYTIEKKISNGDEFCYKIKFNPSHKIYKAHFPNNPVTPGVCLIQIAQELIEYEFGKPLNLFTAPNIKFRQIVKPETTPTFILNKKLEDSLIKVIVKVVDDENLYIKMSLKFKQMD